jgi:hypothetical protein
MSVSATYYVRSGRVGMRAPLYVIFAGSLSVVVLAALYAVVIHYNPFAYFSFLATLIFGAMIGLAGSTAAQAGHSRSTPFDLLAALALAAFGLWASWLIWIALRLEEGTQIAWQLAGEGFAQWREFLFWLAEHTHLTLSRHAGAGTPSQPASQTELFLLWGVEAALIILTALFSAWAAGKDRVYSERCGKWAQSALKCELEGPAMAPEAMRTALEQGRFALLEQYVPVDAQAPRLASEWKTFELELLAEADDPALRILNLSALDNKLDAKGKHKKTEQSVVTNLLLPLTVYEALLERLRSAAESAPSA